MIWTVLKLVDRVIALFEASNEAAAADPLRHRWITVALKRNGRWVRDKRCGRCGHFRRDAAQDDEICRG